MITNLGKTQIKSYFGKQVVDIANYIALGVNPVAAALTDTKLGFEVVRVPVTARADLANSRIVFKGSVLPGQINTAYEIGLYSAGLDINGTNIPILPGLNAAWTGATLASNNARSGSSTVSVTVAANGTGNAELTGVSYDLSSFGATDVVALSFVADTNLSSLRIRLGQSSTSYREYVVNSPSVGYQTARLAYSTGTDTGGPNMGLISYLAIRPSAKAAGSTTVYIDGVRFESSNNNILVARSVLATPSTLDVSVSTDIEYSLAVSV